MGVVQYTFTQKQYTEKHYAIEHLFMLVHIRMAVVSYKQYVWQF